MTVSSGSALKGLFNVTKALGDKIISSDATLEIVGREGLYLLTKQFPFPILTTSGEIEIPMPMGGSAWQPQQAKINQQGGITFMETIDSPVQEFLDSVIEAGGRFNAIVYEGTPTNFKRRLPIYDCFVQIDPPDRDFENKSQILLITGTIFYHYFGQNAG